MIQWSKVIKSGVLATVVMELFYRATNLIFHHGIDVAYGTGMMFSFSSPFLIRLSGYIIFLFGGVFFTCLYARFVRKKSYSSGILYAVVFVWLVVDGFIFEPMGSAGILMLNYGMKVLFFNLLAHAVFGFVLGFMLSNRRNTAAKRNFSLSK